MGIDQVLLPNTPWEQVRDEAQAQSKSLTSSSAVAASMVVAAFLLGLSSNSYVLCTQLFRTAVGDLRYRVDPIAYKDHVCFAAVCRRYALRIVQRRCLLEPVPSHRLEQGSQYNVSRVPPSPRGVCQGSYTPSSFPEWVGLATWRRGVVGNRPL